MKRRCLIIFVKSPDSKNVKSRLARSIGEQCARQLYRQFVLDLLDAMDKGTYGLTIWFHPPNRERTVKEWLGVDRSYTKQIGKNLGERMKNAFGKSFSDGFGAVILIGSDLPDLPAKMIDEAFDSLKDNDVVIGPALDGGYYLIGFKPDTFLTDIFTSISWGTNTVFKSTCEILENKGLRLSVLPPWRDIDTYEDLQSLIAHCSDTLFAKSRTMRFALSLESSRIKCSRSK